jgi:hypothetical protein
MQRKFLPLLREAAQQISNALAASQHVIAAGMSPLRPPP